jgi:GGDEF domain-containing protein
LRPTRKDGNASDGLAAVGVAWVRRRGQRTGYNELLALSYLAVADIALLQVALTDPFTVDQLSLQVEASLGIALYPEHGEDVDQLLQHADVAMYVAKRNGAGCAFYDPEKDRNTPTRLSIVGGR